MWPSLWVQTLLKVGWIVSLQGTDGYIHLLPVFLILFVARLHQSCRPVWIREVERNNILCLHELFQKCCVFNLMLRVTNYLKIRTVLFVNFASTLFKCELCDFSMDTV